MGWQHRYFVNNQTFKAMVKYRLIILSFALCLLLSCSSKNEDKNQEINGKVTEKYRDDHNHGAATIVYKNSSGEFTYQIDEWAINSDLWEYLQTSDSIIKSSGTLTLRVKKKNGDFKDYRYQR